MKQNLDQPPHHFLPVIGMEVHTQLKTQSKMFCSCPNDPFHAKNPNIFTCPTCLGLPGGLPVANQLAIDWTIKLGLALSCQINLISKFDRKHYFYPDLPKGYQISQYDLPLCQNGKLNTSFGLVRIRRIHLEEDTGKLIHTKLAGENTLLIDFNRSGVPLVEIVTEPDIHSANQAMEFSKKLKAIIKSIGISDADMEKGSLRLEANVSLSNASDFALNQNILEKPSHYLRQGAQLTDYIVELKNINSFKFLASAIDYEIDRQAQSLNSNITPIQETRGFDQETAQTYSQRVKEEAADYRYFPDPDLPVIRLTQSNIDQIRSTLDELPSSTVERWYQEYQIDPKTSQVLLQKSTSAKLDKVFKLAKERQIKLIQLANHLVNSKLDIELVHEPEKLFKSYKNLTIKISIDDSQLAQLCQSVISQNPDVVDKYRAGKTSTIGFLIGQVIKKSGQKLDPSQVQTCLINLLKQDNL